MLDGGGCMVEGKVGLGQSLFISAKTQKTNYLILLLSCISYSFAMHRIAVLLFGCLNTSTFEQALRRAVVTQSWDLARGVKIECNSVEEQTESYQI